MTHEELTREAWVLTQLPQTQAAWNVYSHLRTEGLQTPREALANVQSMEQEGLLHTHRRVWVICDRCVTAVSADELHLPHVCLHTPVPHKPRKTFLVRMPARLLQHWGR